MAAYTPNNNNIITNDTPVQLAEPILIDEYDSVNRKIGAFETPTWSLCVPLISAFPLVVLMGKAPLYFKLNATLSTSQSSRLRFLVRFLSFRPKTIQMQRNEPHHYHQQHQGININPSTGAEQAGAGLTHPHVQSNQRPHQLLQLRHQLQVRSDNFNSY